MALKLKGSTSGFVALDSPAVAGNNTITLPDSNGSANQVWANDNTAGVTTYTQVTINRNGDIVTPGTLSIGGTITYEDVTNVDSVGLVTAAQGVRINGGGLSVIGITTGISLSGVLTATNDIGIGDSIFHIGDDNTAIRFPAADTITAETGGSEALRIDSSQRLLIGTTTEGHANGDDLTIATSGDTGMTIRSGTTSNGRIYFSDATSGTGEYAGALDYDHNDNKFTVFTNSDERLRISSGGQVSINSTNTVGFLNVKAEDDGNFHVRQIGAIASGPAGSGIGLDVLNDAGNAVKDLALRGSTVIFRTASAESLRIDSSGRLLLGTTTEGQASADDLTVATSGATGITIRSGTSSNGNLFFSDGTSGGDEYRGYVQYQHGVNSLELGSNGVTALIINTSQDAQFAGIVTTTTGQFVTPNTTGSLATRNRIINGAMEIHQRGSAELTVNSSSNVYLADRWVARSESGDAFLMDVSTSAPYGFSKSLKINCSTASSGGANEIHTVTQNIEGTNVADFGFGGGSARTISVSFWVRSSLTGDFGGALQNSAQNRSYPFVYNIGSADTWEYKSVVITGPTSGSWNNNTNIGLRLTFDLGCGSNFRGNAGAWNSADDRGPSGAVSMMQTQNSTWYVTGVQVEMGPAATPFEYLTQTAELQRCWRYYYIAAAGASAGNSNRSPICTTANYSATYCFGVVYYGVRMRATPTIAAVEGTNYFRCFSDGGSDTFDNVGLQSSSPEAYTLQFYGNLSRNSGSASWVETENAATVVAFQSEIA